MLLGNFNSIHPVSSYIRRPYSSILLSLGNRIRSIAKKLCLEYNTLGRGGFEAVVEESITIGKVNPIAVEKSSKGDVTFDPNEYYFILMIGFPHKYVFTVKEYWDLYKAIDSGTSIRDIRIESLLAKISVYDAIRESAGASIVLDNISSNSGLMVLPIPSPYELLDEKTVWLSDYVGQPEDSRAAEVGGNYIVQASYLYRREDKYAAITSIVMVSNDIVDAYMGVYDSRELADVLMLAGPRVLELKFEDSFMREIDLTSLIDFLYRVLGGLQKTCRILS